MPKDMGDSGTFGSRETMDAIARNRPKLLAKAKAKTYAENLKKVKNVLQPKLTQRMNDLIGR